MRQMTARTWATEAALRMLDNNLDPEVAERPEDLVVYGGTGKAARDHASLAAIRRCLVDLESDETLLVQSGRPVGVFRTHEWAPRVLLANSNLVGDWATWPEFRRLEQLGLTMYGQMTAGSWIYIGSQGILQGTYETFAAVARARFDGSLAGTLTLTAGLGGMGGAQPLAVTMNGGTALVVECDPARAAPPHRDRLPGRDRVRPGRRAGAGVRGARGPGGGVGRGHRQRGRGAAGDPPPRRGGGRRHRPDVRARPARVPADRRRARGLGGLRAPEARGVHRPGAGVDGHARRGDARVQGRRAPRCSTTATRSAARR